MILTSEPFMRKAYENSIWFFSHRLSQTLMPSSTPIFPSGAFSATSSALPGANTYFTTSACTATNRAFRVSAVFFRLRFENVASVFTWRPGDDVVHSTHDSKQHHQHSSSSSSSSSSSAYTTTRRTGRSRSRSSIP